jgi:hypothetical protein
MGALEARGVEACRGTEEEMNHEPLRGHEEHDEDAEGEEDVVDDKQLFYQNGA